jgi:hypothetical protein
VIEKQRLSLRQSEPPRVIEQYVTGNRVENFIVKFFRDFTQAKIAGKNIVAFRGHVATPRQTYLLLDERKDHANLRVRPPASSSLTSCADSRNPDLGRWCKIPGAIFCYAAS